MKHYQTHLAEVCSRLNRHRARYVLVGAQAMQLWGTTRATRDIDILIEKTVTGRLQDAADIEVLEEIKRLRGKGAGS
ncbi:MAG: hypothetical protein HYW06_11480 [Gemmatimonadetes bacterium]|nr:hypothetical protein [Gemmatimonadota bacterium]MBI2403294.1 hypothetical protein [Gemmatimonadota bacterium]MBI2537555.1 hypothetical protein [Gemmatimonadota bacterium]